ncbi:MAG: hypothetical protein WAT93_08330 [Pontixanthobacter sp.]
MAKSATKPAGRIGGQKSRRPAIIGLVLVAAIAVTAFAYRAPIAGYAGAGAAYSARVACSCRYIGNRSLSDCEKDKLDGMELITLKEDADTKSVTAQFPLIASETATYRKGFGCVLQKWDE